MFVLSIEHVTPALGGYLTRHMQLLRHGIYVGSVNARVRAEIIQKIEDERTSHDDLSAIGVYNFNNELGFSYVTIGEPSKTVSDFDGLQLLSTIDTRSAIERFAFSLWAKYNPLYKSLYHHMYETGMMANKFLTDSVYSALIPVFKMFIDNETSDDDIISWLSFLIASHDIGKASPGFQLKAKDAEDYHIEYVLDYIQKESMFCNFTETDGFRHEIVSGKIIKNYLKKENCDFNTKQCIKTAYENHHLSKIRDNDINAIYEEEGKNKWETVHYILLNKLLRDFKVNIFLTVKKEKKEEFTNLLLNLIYRCDWMTSSVFNEKEAETIPYKEYVDNTLNKYIEYLDIHKIDYSKVNSACSIHDMFPYIAKPRPMQLLAEMVGKEFYNFDCLIIEDETGSGKTEAGLYLAYKAMLAHKKQGIFFGLPTNTTEETMNPRVQVALDSLFGENVFSVRHATGKSWMKYDTNVTENERFINSTHRMQKVMYPFVTGTVDQIELSVLKTKYATIQLMDLSTKVVVIDEMHAYDAYMRGVLCRALEWFHAYNVPVIIMSATLPEIIKKEIYEVYHCTTENTYSSYPLLTLISDRHVNYYVPNEKKADKALGFRILPIFEDDNRIADHACSIVKNGGNLAIIVNSVRKAISLYETLKKSANIPLYLFHGRNTEYNKEENTKLLYSLYSKEAKDKGNRPEKSIVVSTQILEQSIDVDFDYMMSELAPIDLLIQRAGRERRHDDKDTIRENNPSQKALELLVTEDKDMGAHAVYAKQEHSELLRRTLELAENKKTIHIPSELRKWIETVYTVKYDSDDLKASRANVETIEGLCCNDYLPFKKAELRSNAPTRISDYESVNVAVVSDNMLRNVKDHLTKELSAEIMQKYCLSVPVNLIKNSVPLFSGEKWLDGVLFLDSKKYKIDKILGLVSQNVI